MLFVRGQIWTCFAVQERWKGKKRTGTGTALLICCDSAVTVCLGGPGVFMELMGVGRSRTSSGVALTPG